MPAFSQSLEKALHQALTIANERHHEFATLEHLLLALIDDTDAAAVMRACNVDLEELRGTVLNYIDTELDNLVTGYDEDFEAHGRVSRGSFSARSSMCSRQAARKCPAPTCWSRSLPSAKATPHISCRNSR